MKKKVLLILSCLFLSIGFILAQTSRATGTVVDSNGEPVVSASVVVKGTTVGTVTDIDGNFSVNVPSGSNTLVFKLIGMQVVEAHASENMKIVMEEDSQLLGEVVFEVAYGVAKKESFTGSADVIMNDKISKRPVANVTKALEGLATGIKTTSGSGQPGEGASIRIRGMGSINASSNPLYVVDGVPYDGSISAINPNDISSMTVLKDASAGALYGSRGANGVIIITTKRGESGKVQVNFKANWGVASRAIPRYETMDERGYISSVFHSVRNQKIREGVAPNLAGTAAINEMASGGSRIFGELYEIPKLDEHGNTVMVKSNQRQYFPFLVPDNKTVESMIDPVTGMVSADAQFRYRDDWYDYVTAKNPLRQEYDLSVSGGNDKNKYMFSLGYLNENGLLETTKFERFSGRLGVDSELHKWVNAGLNANFSKNSSNTSSTTPSGNSNTFYTAQLMAPIFPIFERGIDGSYELDLEGNKVFDYGHARPSGASTGFNSIATLYDDKYLTESDNFSARTYVEVGNFKETPLDGLKLTANLGVDYQSGAQLTYYNPYFGNSEGVKGSSTKESRRTFSYTFNQLLNYKRNFNGHEFDVLAGHEFYRYQFNYLGGAKTGFPLGGLTELDAATTVTGASSYQHLYTIESVLSRLNYNYNDKYYFSASLRSDGSSRFPKGKRWGTFWSLGASWRISQEDFMKEVTWVDNLTLKASYGVQGNDNLLDDEGYQLYYAWQSFYDLAYPNASQIGALATTLENTDLRWEKNGNFNVGVEARLFDRVSATLEWFNRKTTDLLLKFPMPLSSGFKSYNKNVGEMTNTGIEISIATDVIRSKDFDWRLTLMGSTLKNKVTTLYGDGREERSNQILQGSNIIKEGEAVNSFYVAKSAGVDPATGDQLYWAYDIKDGVQSEPYITNDMKKANNSRFISGSRFADFEGSISNDFRYKGFDLSMLCTYSIGGKILEGVYKGMLYPSYIGNTAHKNRERAWKNPGDITDVPRLDIGTSMINTTDDLIDASYFAIKNITLGYTLPTGVSKSMGLGSVRFTATADNLVMFTHLKGMNPQYNFSGSTSYAYTPVRTVTFGLDVKF